MADNELREQVRIHLIQCRVEHELTQTEVGKIVGKSKNAVASWEQGLSLPDAVTLYKLAKYYGKDMAFMYGEERLSHEKQNNRASSGLC